jgi:hypothetical protein
VQAKAVGPHRQGSVVGLQQTMNRLVAIAIPPAMGAIADHWGAGLSFVILGTVLIVLHLDHPTRSANRNKSGGSAVE